MNTKNNRLAKAKAMLRGASCGDIVGSILTVCLDKLPEDMKALLSDFDSMLENNLIDE